MAENTVGRSSAVKEAFVTQVMRAADEIQPLTRQLKRWRARARDLRVRLVPSRMVDDVRAMLASFHRNEIMDGKAIDAELPVIFVAFGKNQRPAPETWGMTRGENEPMRIDDAWYHARLAMKEWDVQLAFLGHEQESVVAMVDYVRLFFFRFENHRWRIPWHYDGHDFFTYGMLHDGFEPEELSVDLGERTNICCHALNFPIGFMMPYIGEEAKTVARVNMNITQQNGQTVTGAVDAGAVKAQGSWDAHST